MADKGFLDKPRKSITDDRDEEHGKPHSLRYLGRAVAQGARNMIELGKADLEGRRPDLDFSPLEDSAVEPADPKNYGR